MHAQRKPRAGRRCYSDIVKLSSGVAPFARCDPACLQPCVPGYSCGVIMLSCDPCE
ncbi:hypothetical protein BKA93DRAFT_756125 [Sparassis latifolia]